MAPLKLNGSSSGYVAVEAPASAGSNTLTLPTSSGSANQYLKNSGTPGVLEFAAVSAGKLLQATTTADAARTDTATTSISSSTWADTTITAVITPGVNTSKIIVSGQLYGEGNASDHLFQWRLKRVISGGATTYIQGAAAGSRTPVLGPFLVGLASDGGETSTYASLSNYLDSPATTSAVTYTFQVWYNGAATFYVNRTVADTDGNGNERGVSWLTLMEVGA